MRDMERRRLQLYAKSIRREALRRQIEALEYVLGPMLLELDRLEQDDVDVVPVLTTKARPRKRRRR
jgi:hypothetical protein